MNLYEILKQLNIQYKEIEHEPVYTVEQAQFIKNYIEGTGCKNLFLTNRKNQYYLVILEESKRLDIKKLAQLVNQSHLSFASSQRLKMILDLEPGSVTPLGIINDKDNLVTLLIDKELQNKNLLVHPNTNTKTLSISYDDLIKFIEYENHTWLIFE